MDFSYTAEDEAFRTELREPRNIVNPDVLKH